MNKSRRQMALEARISAAQMAEDREHPEHISNGDEQKFRHDQSKEFKPNYLASYTTGLPHDYDTGLIINPADFQKFVNGIDSGDPRDFCDTPLGAPENCFFIFANPSGSLQKPSTYLKVKMQAVKPVFEHGKVRE